MKDRDSNRDTFVFSVGDYTYPEHAYGNLLYTVHGHVTWFNSRITLCGNVGFATLSGTWPF